MIKPEDSETDPDGPGDLFYPFSDLRLVDNPPELRVSRELFANLATLHEQQTSSYAATAAASIGALAWAVRELEIQLSVDRCGPGPGPGPQRGLPE